LLPQNSGSTQSALPYAIPCFENSPVYWKGTIIWNDGTQDISKAVQIPWARVQQDMRGPDELALKRDIPSIDTALSTTSTNPVQNKAIYTALSKKADNNFNVFLCNDSPMHDEVEALDEVFAGFRGHDSSYMIQSYATDSGVTAVHSLALMETEKGAHLAWVGIDGEWRYGKLSRDPSMREVNALAWQANTSLLTVTPDSAGAVTFDVTGWPEGGTLLVRLTTPEDFELPEEVRLVGYFALEPASTYQISAYVMNGVMHLVPLVKED
jgi:hypothetical protein